MGFPAVQSRKASYDDLLHIAVSDGSDIQTFVPKSLHSSYIGIIRLSNGNHNVEVG